MSGSKILLQVIGIVSAGFGLSSTVFSPLQTLLINPSNLPPLKAGKEIGNKGKMWIIPGRWGVQLHFSLLQTGGGAHCSTSRPSLQNVWQVLANLPPTLLYVAAIYAVMFTLGKTTSEIILYTKYIL